MKIHLIFLLLVWFCGCSNQNPEYDLNEIIKTESKYEYKLKGNDQSPTGKIYKILKSGEKKYIGELSKGIPFGDWKNLDEAGNVLEQVHFSNGVPGRKYVALYHKNGKKSLEGSYLRNKKNGLFAMYYENGIRSFRGEYLNGSGVGIWLYFDEDGNEMKRINCSLEDCK
tara:strand:- start:193 stop:699 length:507 start_codon:yes stop_codon:yes gene_type:complete